MVVTTHTVSLSLKKLFMRWIKWVECLNSNVLGVVHKEYPDKCAWGIKILEGACSMQATVSSVPLLAL